MSTTAANLYVNFSVCPTVKMIASRLKEQEIGPIVSLDTTRRLLRTLGFCHKRVDSRVRLVEKTHLRDWRRKYIQRMNENDASENPKDVIFLDESWIDCNLTAKNGWCPKICKSTRDRVDHSINKKPGKGPRLILLHAGQQLIFYILSDSQIILINWQFVTDSLIGFKRVYCPIYHHTALL